MSQISINQAMQEAIGHHQAGRLPDAEAIYRQILSLQPQHRDALHMLGVLVGQCGQHEAATLLIRQAIALSPATAAFHYTLGVYQEMRGQFDEGLGSFQQAVALNPDYAEAHHRLGNAWNRRGQSDKAVASFQRALALKPGFAAAHQGLGNTRQIQGLLVEAAACYKRALDCDPESADAHYDLGNILGSMGRIDEAIACYHRALALNPDMPAAHNNLGSLWLNGRQFEAAIACYQRVVALRPNVPEFHHNLGTAFLCKGMLDDAQARFLRALTLNSSLVQAHIGLGNVWKERGDIEQAVACYGQALAVDPRNRIARDNLIYLLQFHPRHDAQRILREGRQWEALHGEPAASPFKPHNNVRDSERRLRIGYVSPDFVRHPVGRFMLPLLASHDRTLFQTYCYANVTFPDDMTHRLRGHADVWRNIVAMGDEQAAQLIRDDEIDILVDLSMHMCDNRLLIFTRRPAPVLVTYLAYAGGTAVGGMDYRLTDAHLDPDEAQDGDYLEKSVRLAGGYWCYAPDDAAPLVGELPAIRNGWITLGCLNNFCKLSPSAVQAMVEVLKRLPRARLLLVAPLGDRRDRLLDLIRREGISSERLELVGRVSAAEYFQTYNRMDIALDPFPYAGGTTTCDALWMGVPVVTLAGTSAVGRAGVSLLSNVGMPELIAGDVEAYVRIAVDLAGDLPRLAGLRATLRERMGKAPLMDAGRFTRGIEQAYRQMWLEWCNMESRAYCAAAPYASIGPAIQ